MMSLFYGLSALLMAAAHYTLCDETSVVEASTGVSMWGDLAAGWLLANHKPLAGLVLTGTTVFSMWVVMSVLQRMDESDVDSKEPLSRSASQSSNRDANAEEEKAELYTYPPSAQCHYVAVADSVLMAAPAETDMSLTGPYNSGSIPVDPLMRSYMGGDPYRRAKMAFAKVAAENAGAGGVFATPKQLGILATPKRHTPDGGFYCGMDRPTSLPRAY
jgi:hypothetical protein